MDLLSKSRLHGCREVSLICDLVERDRQVAERNKEQVVLNDVLSRAGDELEGFRTHQLCSYAYAYALLLNPSRLTSSSSRQVQDELEGTRPRRLRWRSDTVLNRLPFSYPRVPNMITRPTCWNTSAMGSHSWRRAGIRHLLSLNLLSILLLSRL
jgi:hypothetical protein